MNDAFDIYVINLDKDKSRLDKITRHLSPNKFNRIKAIYGEDYNFYKDDTVYITCKYFCPKSTIGIALSHRLALKTFLDSSDKEYLLLLEDDAEPCYENYIEMINEYIKTAPDDWDIIKLDYEENNISKYIWSSETKKGFTQYYSPRATAQIIKRSVIQKILNSKIYWHCDADIYFININIYNSPQKVFVQIWDKNNKSNNRKKWIYPGTDGEFEVLNFKIIRIGTMEFSANDIIYLFLFILLFFLLNRYYLLDLVMNKFKTVLSINKTK
jgi:GR25 family glycosyltransferase involved in LPS biosynthesis